MGDGLEVAGHYDEGVRGAPPASVALQALLAAVERRLGARGVGPPPDAFLLGRYRGPLIEALRQGLLEYVAVLHWPSFARLSRVLCRKGLDGFRAAVALSLPEALTSGVTVEVMESLEHVSAPRPPSVLFGRLTRTTCGHVIFRSQLLALAEGECGTTPLEMAGLLDRHTPAAIRAMLYGRLIKGRPDLDSGARQSLVELLTRHLGRLLPEAAASQHAVRLLRLAYYRLHHPAVARPVLRRVRIVDFSARRVAAPGRARPRG